MECTTPHKTLIEVTYILCGLYIYFENQVKTQPFCLPILNNYKEKKKKKHNDFQVSKYPQKTKTFSYVFIFVSGVLIDIISMLLRIKCGLPPLLPN